MAKWEELAEDDLVEILLKCCVKSLIRLCCVSKSLGAFIKNSDFSSLYSKCNKQDIVVVVRDVEYDHSLISFFLPTRDEDDSLTLTQVSTDLRIPFHDVPGVCLIGPCNGLICVSGFHDQVVLWKPILQEFKLLPPTTFSCRRSLSHVLEIMGLGLGFDPCANDYKLVRIVEIYGTMLTDNEDDDEDEDEDEKKDDNEDDDEDEDEDEKKDDGEGIRAEVYDFPTNLWRKIEAQVPFFNSSPFPRKEFFYKGGCHICGYKTTICFNISSETFTTINYPQAVVDSHETSECVTLIDDCFALVNYVYDMEEPTLIDIWVMKEYGNKESWVKQFTIGPIFVRRPLISWGDNIILFREKKNKQLICCELDTNKVTKFDIYSHHEYAMDAIIFRESLLSILSA